MTTPAPVLLATTDAKSYLRIETDREDALIKSLIDEVVGLIETSIGKSLTTEVVTWYDSATTFKSYGSPSQLLLGYVPIDPTTVVVNDGQGNTVGTSAYTVRPDLCAIVSTAMGGFDNGTYSITCTAGFGTDSKYATRWLPMIRALMLDYVAFLYQQRTPGARSESAAGTRVEYEIDASTGLPTRICSGLRKLRGPVVTR